LKAKTNSCTLASIHLTTTVSAGYFPTTYRKSENIRVENIS